MHTLLICHPHRMIRESWINFFTSQGLTVLADTNSYQTCLVLAQALRPNVVIVASDLIGLSDLKRFNNVVCGDTKLVLLSAQNPATFRRYLRQAGVRAILSVNSSLNEMHRAITRLHPDTFYISHAFDIEANRADEFTNRLSLLTKKEWEVLNLLLEGRTSKEIADAIGVSYKTVDVHRYHLLQKTGCHKTVRLLNRLNAAFQ